jgi:hypothetical protein
MYVRFTSQSGQTGDVSLSPLSAISRHMGRSKLQSNSIASSARQERLVERNIMEYLTVVASSPP